MVLKNRCHLLTTAVEGRDLCTPRNTSGWTASQVPSVLATSTLFEAFAVEFLFYFSENPEENCRNTYSEQQTGNILNAPWNIELGNDLRLPGNGAARDHNC